MKKIRFTLKGFAFVLCALAFTPAIAKQSTDVSSLARNPIDQTITDINFLPTAGLKIENSAEVLKSHLEIDDPNQQLISAYTQRPGDGLAVQRFEQWYKGIKVAHGSFSVAAKNGIITYAHGNIFRPSTELSTAAALTESQALQKALDFINAQDYMWQNPKQEKMLREVMKDPNATYFPKGTMVWVEDFNSTARNKQLHLAYCFNIYAEAPLSRNLVYIDANTGNVLLKDPVIKHITATGKSLYSGNVSFETDMSGSSYILYDNTRGVYTGSFHNGTTTQYDVANSSTTWATNQAIDAHWGAVNVYDYWGKEQSRASYDGIGSALNSFVNYDVGYNNAFWNGAWMTYGDGTGVLNGGFDPLTAQDVCAHEIGHGVCQTTCGLVYQSESGGMNEGFSDIWGETIEHYASPEKPMWQIGAEIARVPLRSMRIPKQYGNPDTYNGTYWVTTGSSCTSSNDYCGVHTNSGVLNKWYYLLTDGGSGTNDASISYVVGGLGLQKAARIAYGTELLLTSTDNYAACRTASIGVATTIYGACSPEVEAVTRAWRAVNVGAAFAPCGPQIGFVNHDTVVNKVSGSTACPASKTIDIPITINAAATGSNPIVTVTGTGTAVLGTDYSFVNNTVTFTAGTISTEHILLNILDNGATTTDKDLTLTFSISPGNDATIGNVYHEYKIIIKGNSTLPQVAGDVDYYAADANLYTKIATPFFGAAQSARTQFIITAADMKASGVKPNTPISVMSFNVVDKKSTKAFSNYTVKLGLTTQALYNGSQGFVSSGLTTYFSGSFVSAAGWNKIILSSPFTWDGLSNVVCEICFANSVAATSADSNDRVEASNSINNITAYNFQTSGTSACGLSFSTFKLSNSRPRVAFTQAVANTEVETAAPSDRSWDVHANQDVYFYSNANNKLIAQLNLPSQDLGCVNASVSKQGNGFSPFALGQGANRSSKEFNIQATTNGNTATSTTTIYFDTAELGNVITGNVRIIKTTAARDSDINVLNTQLVTPTLVTTNANFKGFTGNFTGFSRFFLVDKDVVLPTVGIKQVNKINSMNVDNNPFSNTIFISYSINSDTKATVHLFDITGKMLYNSDLLLMSGQNRFSIDVSNLSLIPGQYVLQIITPTDVLTRKMIKQ